MIPPAVVSAHVCSAPAKICDTPLARPDTFAGDDCDTAKPSPSCPTPFSPQHLAPPPVVSAQVSNAPAAIWATPLPSPLTPTAVELGFVDPLPSWPELLSPQHFTPPPVVSAHV